MDAEEQRRGGLLVGLARRDDFRDPPLGRRQIASARSTAADAAELSARLLRPQPGPKLLEDVQRPLERVACLLPAAGPPLRDALCEHRPGEVERLRQVLVHEEGVRVGGERRIEVALRGEDQPLAAPCARLSVWALGTARALLKICQKPARLRELAQLDERFDRIRQLTVDARLTPSRRL